jgi:DNA-nicking Smr family endonuclease
MRRTLYTVDKIQNGKLHLGWQVSMTGLTKTEAEKFAAALFARSEILGIRIMSWTQKGHKEIYNMTKSGLA